AGHGRTALPGIWRRVGRRCNGQRNRACGATGRRRGGGGRARGRGASAGRRVARLATRARGRTVCGTARAAAVRCGRPGKPPGRRRIGAALEPGVAARRRDRNAHRPCLAPARLRLPWRRGFLERRVESRLPRLRIKTFRNIAATARSASRLRPTTGDSLAATDIPIRTRVLPVGLAWLIWLSITAEPTPV